ncbi:MAG: hypothetical protein HUJ29_00945 [Gammaproteobacteria bacterium]|nr:hypothetical protein [Gammaproteobacteria bacterium]
MQDSQASGQQAQALVMTGLKRDEVKTVTDAMRFYGLRRQSSQAKPPRKITE